MKTHTAVTSSRIFLILEIQEIGYSASGVIHSVALKIIPVLDYTIQVLPEGVPLPVIDTVQREVAVIFPLLLTPLVNFLEYRVVLIFSINTPHHAYI